MYNNHEGIGIHRTRIRLPTLSYNSPDNSPDEAIPGGLAWALRSIDKLVHEETYQAVSQPCKVTFETVQ